MRYSRFAALFAAICRVPTTADGFKAGVASKVITPTEPMWMAGYASRNKPGEGKRHDLYVKALASKTRPATAACW